MLLSAAETMTFSANNGDSRFPVTDFLFDAGRGTVKYAALDIGGWFDQTQVLISANRLGEPDTAKREFVINLASEEVENAPKWEPEGETFPFDMAHLPPLVVGPFGSTYAPLMMAAQMNEAQASDDAAESADLPPGADRLDRFSIWLGTEVFGSDGELGRLGDILLDPAKMELTHFVVETGGILSTQEHVLPYQTLRHMAKGDTHLVLSTSKAAVEKSPKPKDIKALDQGSIDALRLHYGLPM